MRLFVTLETGPVSGPVSGLVSGRARHDVLVTCAPETRVADLAAALAGSGTSARGGAAADLPANVVALPGAASVPTLTGAPDLFLGEQRLDPDERVDATAVRHGVVLGLGCPSSQRGQEPGGLVEVRVSSGPGAGHVHRLGIGRATVGHASHCTIRLPELAEDPGLADVEDVLVLEVATDGSVTVTPDPAVADETMPVPLRREPVTAPIVLEASTVSESVQKRRLRRRKKVLEFQLGDRVDPGDAVPLVHLDRRPLDGATAWEPQQTLGVGPVLLDRVEITRPDASLSPSPAEPTLDYNRPPRLHPAAQPNEFTLPMEPRRPDKMPFPLSMMMMPVLMSGVAFFITHRWYTLLFAAAMPLMMLANATGSRRQQKRRYVEQLDDFHRRRANIESAAVTSLVGERGARRRNFPDPATVLLFATGPRARLWERRPWDRDFLHLRLGTSDLPSEVTIKDPTRDAHEGPLRWTAPDVPVTVPLRSAGVLGIAGTADQCRASAMWAVAQVGALHSPSDVAVAVLLGSDPSPAWDWVKWLPHVRNGDGHPRPVRLATGEDDRSALVTELMGELESRRELGEKEIAGLRRWVVVLDGAREIRMSPGMVSLLKDGPRVGISFVCLDRTVRELPEECRTVASYEGGQLNLETDEQRHVDAIRPDVVGDLWLDRLARALAPIRDVSTEDLSSTLPASSRLLDVLRISEPDARQVLQGWSGRGRTTRAVIGETGDGLFSVDVRADGPHGLVAGTTGAGKSELLQTLIASLAVGQPARRVRVRARRLQGRRGVQGLCPPAAHGRHGHRPRRPPHHPRAGVPRGRAAPTRAAAGRRGRQGHRGLPRRPRPRRRADAPAAHRDRRVRGAGRRAARLRHRPGRRGPPRSLARRTPDPGHPAPRRRGERGDQVQHQPADRAAGDRPRRLRGRDRVARRRADLQVVPGSRLRPARALLAGAVPELPRRRPAAGRRRVARGRGRPRLGRPAPAGPPAHPRWRRRGRRVGAHRPRHPRRRDPRRHRRARPARDAPAVAAPAARGAGAGRAGQWSSEVGRANGGRA